MSASWFRIALALALAAWIGAHVAIAVAAIAAVVRLAGEVLAGAAPWTWARAFGVLATAACAWLLLVPHGLLRPRRAHTVLLALGGALALVQVLAGALPLWPVLVAALLYALERGWRALSEPEDADDAPAGFKGESYRQVRP